MSDYIPYGRQDISDDDIQAVVDVLQSDWLTQGPTVPNFEQSVAKYCGAQFAVAMNSATSALHAACIALGLKEGDWLWTSPNTFVASSNCGLYCGAQIDFVDIDPRTYNMCVAELEKKLIKAEAQGTLPKIVIPVHFAGQSCQMREIKVLADKYGFSIIEDASHAIGGQYLDEPIGNCKYSDVTIFSFHPVKVITTGEGGMAMSNNAELANKMALIRSHGITRDPKKMINKADGAWNYQQIALGYNYRLTDIQAALGINQMQRINDFVKRRHEIANCYDLALKDVPVVTPWRNRDCYSSFHLYVVKINSEGTKGRKQVFDALRAMNIGVNVHYMPVYLQPYYYEIGFRPGYCPQAELYYEHAISLPMFPKLSLELQDEVILKIKRALCRES